jgi:hypothetical protein
MLFDFINYPCMWFLTSFSFHYHIITDSTSKMNPFASDGADFAPGDEDLDGNDTEDDDDL